MSRVFVNQRLGNDLNPGSESAQLMTIAAAISSPANNEIFIQDGIYSEIIDSVKFDQARRKLVGIGDVYLAAQGNVSSFNGKLINNHLFKNIKFVNYTDYAVQLGGLSIFSCCFFKALQKLGSSVFFINNPSILDIRKCTFVNNETICNLSTQFPWSTLKINNIENSLFFNHSFHLKKGAETNSFSVFLTEDQDKGNYYDNNIHLANGGINSSTGENPPLFVNPIGGDYDLLQTSALIGAGYLGSDIGSFHEFVPLTSTTDEPVSLFDPGWQNDSLYFDMGNMHVGPQGPVNAAGMIQATVNGRQRWMIDLASTPKGRSGRLISPIIDLKMTRLITRASWSAEEDLSIAGSKKMISASNLLIPDMEIRGSLGSFEPDVLSPLWIQFNKMTSINLSAKYVQLRTTFRLDGV